MAGKATNWTLQQNINLATANWTASASADIGNNGTLKTANSPTTGGNRFFAWRIRELVFVTAILFERDDGLNGLI